MLPFLTEEQLDAGRAHVLASPRDEGRVEMLVRRPAVGTREIIERGELIVGQGLLGDNYLVRGNAKTPDGKAHPEAQINIMNSRAVDLVAGGDRGRWALAGDQLFVDLSLREDQLPAGTRLEVGTGILEVSRKPHTGCAKFADRYGRDAAKWINADAVLRMRGLNAMVVQSGVVRVGDRIVIL